MPTDEHRILDAALKALKRTTGLDAQIHAATAGRDRATDAIIELTTNQRKHRFRAEVKAVDRFDDPGDNQGSRQSPPRAAFTGRALHYP